LQVRVLPAAPGEIMESFPPTVLFEPELPDGDERPARYSARE
jgi:hypothetical protein